MFISHAGADVQPAMAVAGFLKRANVEARLDRGEIGPGASFIKFMESALTSADYCLLLWSGAARASNFVTEEWQNALCRAIEEQRAFLTVGRLEDLPVPGMLRSRIWVDLFPRLEPGLLRIIGEWKSDRCAAAESGRPVGASAAIEETGGTQVYISSDLYGFTHPARLRLEQPAGVLLDHILKALCLRARIEDSEQRVGIKLDYRLRMRGHDLARSESPMSRGARENEVFQLVVTATIVAATQPTSPSLVSAEFLSDEGLRPTPIALTERQRQLVLNASNI